MTLSLFGYRLMSRRALRELETRAGERHRAAYERRIAEESERLDRRLREAETIRESAERRCREMESECRASIRRQYDVFDKQWRDREARAEARVLELGEELEKLEQALSAYTDKGRKLLSLAIDRRTPEAESVAAFLKARAQGIRLV